MKNPLDSLPLTMLLGFLLTPILVAIDRAWFVNQGAPMLWLLMPAWLIGWFVAMKALV